MVSFAINDFINGAYAIHIDQKMVETGVRRSKKITFGKIHLLRSFKQGLSAFKDNLSHSSKSGTGPSHA
jgi:hypothetical protein